MGWVTRFAPSPNGLLHLGHAASAHGAWRRARESGGRFLLRLEDIDAERCRPDYAAAILEDLAWLGLDWDGPVMRQSGRFPFYQACLDELRGRGLLYPCFCSRAEIRASASAPHADDGTPVYPGTCRRLGSRERETRMASGAPHAWRLDMGRAMAGVPALLFVEECEGEFLARPEQFGDVLLGRRDAPASYHLCATYDDAAQGVTLVTRGEDLRQATHLHRLLQHLMDWPTPIYAHHALVTDGEGRRLSKRHGAVSLATCRQSGLAPADVFDCCRSSKPI